MTLPTPDADARQHSRRLQTHIADAIAAAGGWISFARFMELALYAPGLGYYTAGARKFGADGDFVTAPELSPLFARSLAPQAAQIMAASGPRIIEAGAGTGRLAADLPLALEALGSLPESYAILDLSPDLRQRQAATLEQRAPHLLARVQWLDRLPQRFSGLVLGNEVLDATVRFDGSLDPFGPKVLFVTLGADGANLTGGSRAAQWMILDQLVDELRGRIPQDSQFALLTPAGRTALARFIGGGGRIAVNIHRAADITRLLRWSKQHGVKVALVGATEAWKVAPQLAAAGVPVFVDPLVNLPGDFDQLGGATTTSRALIVALRRVLEYVQVHATELYAAPAQSDAVEVGSRVR